ncbi:hypothetical protein [Thermoproteus tenax]|uniref:hypothetical protein n=1 Tax=Thermoproteus tenax TaxID=2271 RepID=UPI001433317F|nr:hypothetical protein [Thermoproteus tenax]
MIRALRAYWDNRGVGKAMKHFAKAIGGIRGLLNFASWERYYLYLVAESARACGWSCDSGASSAGCSSSWPGGRASSQRTAK